jgi:peptide/nickel transport system substrate-binding protein
MGDDCAGPHVGGRWGWTPTGKIGIEATMKILDRAPYYTMMRKGEFSIGFSVIDARYEWDDAFYMLFHSSEIGKNNWTMYSNKEVDTLLEKARITWNPEDRRPAYKKVVETLREDLPILFLLKSVIGVCLRDYIKGYRKGFATRFGWHGGGPKYWWLEK